jgi:hypothetical protein
MSGLKELLKNPGFCGMMVGHHNGGISPELLPAFRPGLFLAWGQGFRIFALVSYPTALINIAALYPSGPESFDHTPKLFDFSSGPLKSDPSLSIERWPCPGNPSP